MKIRSFLRSNPGKCLVLVLLLVLAAGSMLWSLKLGSLKLSAAQILETLWNQTGGIRYQIVCNIRLPRILCGALVGAALAVSGAILQGVMRNPLAAPGISGAWERITICAMESWTKFRSRIFNPDRRKRIIPTMIR